MQVHIGIRETTWDICSNISLSFIFFQEFLPRISANYWINYGQVAGLFSIEAAIFVRDSFPRPCQILDSVTAESAQTPAIRDRWQHVLDLACSRPGLSAPNYHGRMYLDVPLQLQISRKHIVERERSGGSRTPNCRESMITFGIESWCRDAYLWHNWCPGDEIDLFGFSRGAYTARAVNALQVAPRAWGIWNGLSHTYNTLDA